MQRIKILIVVCIIIVFSFYLLSEEKPSPNKGSQSFFYLPIFPNVGEEIHFFVRPTSPSRYIWSFGDGSISTEKEPIHIYYTKGIYLIVLSIINNGYVEVNKKNIIVGLNNKNRSVKPVSNFEYQPINPRVGEPVNFYDVSSGEPIRRLWRFGFYQMSFKQDPVVVFYTAGKYLVSLSVENKNGSDKKEMVIDIGPPPPAIKFARSCLLRDVQAAIAEANAGDTVIVPNGEARWNQQLVIRKGIILKAAIKGGVKIIQDFAGANYSWGNFLILYQPENPEANEPFRVSGFKIDCGGKGEGIAILNRTLTPITKIRIDNNEFSNYQTDSYAAVFKVHGTVYGVFDNNVVYMNDSEVYRYIGFYGVDRDTWSYQTYDFGTADNFFVEDNTFYIKNPLQTSDQGGRFTVRYNKIYIDEGGDSAFLMDNHGNQPNGVWATIGSEIYENKIYASGKAVCIMDIRGGKSLVYNNHLYNAASVKVRIREEYHDSLNPPSNNLISGQPQHPSDSYIWGIYNNDVLLIPPTVEVTQTILYDGEGIVPREDKHYFREKQNFDGSSGLGCGLLSQRPNQCTKDGVAWWATDEKKLYIWRNNKWEIYYIPYTYPHPLRTILAE